MIAAALSARSTAATSTTVAAASKAIGEAMRFAPLPDAVRAELASPLRRARRGAAASRRSPCARARSARTAQEATFAGQQESFLWVRGPEQLCDAVRDCWASLYTPRAITYRARARRDARRRRWASRCRMMVDAEVSGVLFTCNPVSGDPSMVAINASWGLGIAVVGGETTPDDFLVSKVTGEVVRRTVNAKDVEYVPDAAGRGTVRVEVPAERRDERRASARSTSPRSSRSRARVERHFGSPPGRRVGDRARQPLPEALVVLQARPVTAVPERTTTLSGSALSLVMSTFGAATEPGAT